MGRCEGPQSVYNGRPEPGGGCYGEPHLLSPLPALYGSLRFKSAFFLSAIPTYILSFNISIDIEKVMFPSFKHVQAMAFLKVLYSVYWMHIRDTKYFMQKNEQKY